MRRKMLSATNLKGAFRYHIWELVIGIVALISYMSLHQDQTSRYISMIKFAAFLDIWIPGAISIFGNQDDLMKILMQK